MIPREAVLTMGTLSPAARQTARKAWLSPSRPGRPWLTLDTPRMVRYPACRTRRMASGVARTTSWLTEAAIARQSMKMAFWGTPAAWAAWATRRAVSRRQ